MILSELKKLKEQNQTREDWAQDNLGVSTIEWAFLAGSPPPTFCIRVWIAGRENPTGLVWTSDCTGSKVKNPVVENPIQATRSEKGELPRGRKHCFQNNRRDTRQTESRFHAQSWELSSTLHKG